MHSSSMDRWIDGMVCGERRWGGVGEDRRDLTGV
jgi:hypothetical protein